MSHIPVTSLVMRGTYANRPTYAADGTIYLVTDKPISWMMVAGAWVAVGPFHNFTAPPAAATWSWINQDSATIADDGGSLLMTCPKGTANSRRCLLRTIPGSTFTVTAGFYTGVFSVSSTAAAVSGMILRDSGSGKLIEFSFFHSSGTFNLQVSKLDNPTHATPTAYTSRAFTSVTNGSVVWLRIVADATNYTWQYSPNGTEFYTWDQRAKTNFLTSAADYIGLTVDQINGETGTNVKMRCVHWEAT